MQHEYTQQHRGDRGAYERYLRGMDASMRQKVALTAAHILSRGVIADMGMGSGTGSEALAALYPALRVIGVDVNPEMVALARERYRLPNLEFVEGDIAEINLAPESLDGILNSSVLHHVTTFNGYDPDEARRALTNQLTQLKTGGVLIVRDFVDPGSEEVFLDLPLEHAQKTTTASQGAEPEEADASPGDGFPDLRACTVVELFERFAREFRKLSDAPGFAFTRVADGEHAPPPNTARFRIPFKLAAEFVLRKDYREDWATEVLEEYTYYTQAEFERVFAELGLRVLASTPIRNPWIVRNRFENQFAIRNLRGEALEFPPTNYLIAGEKVGPQEGVRFAELEAQPPTGFLQLEHYRNLQDGTVMDLVRRPGRTLDAIPWFVADQDCFILARKDYPRPVAVHARSASGRGLDGSLPVGYVSEPLAVIQGDAPIGRTVEAALERFAGIGPERIRNFRRGTTYYPSPGGMEEEVRSVFVEIDPVFVERAIENRTGFSSPGQVRAIETRQLLRAAQVGGLPDARLELNVYQLLRLLGRGAGPWIGERIELRNIAPPANPTTVEQILNGASPRRMFRRCSPDESSGFLALHCREFGEYNQANDLLFRQTREFVAPRPLSCFTMTAAVLRSDGAQTCLGIDDHDLPAAQSFNGNSNLLVTPAWRLPHSIANLTQARDWIRERLAKEYGIQAGEIRELGGPYMPSPGATPEIAYPVSVEVLAETNGARSLRWVSLQDFAHRSAELRDGHLRIVGLRAAHALGLLE